jgi:L-fuculose-phosphate aldolase
LIEAHILRAEIIATARALEPARLGVNRSGNVSARHADGFLITPTGVPYDGLRPADLPHVRLSDGAASGPLLPSSETPFHRAIYAARPELNAIVHCHSPHATALACAGRPIPPFHYMVAVAGGSEIACVPYATFGSEALSDHAVAALGERRRACLLANHGQIACGRTLDAALELAREVEALAQQYLLSLLVPGGPVLLDEAEMARVLAKFETYGRQPGPEPDPCA